MFRLRWLIVPLWMGCVSCAVIIAALSAGWYDWQTFVVAAGLAVVIGVPAGILTTRYLRTHPRHGDAAVHNSARPCGCGAASLARATTPG